MECDECGIILNDDDVYFMNGIPYCEICYWEDVDECPICGNIFPKIENDDEGKYHFVFYGSAKNPDMEDGIYRADEFPFWWNVMFSDPTIIESAVTWVAPAPILPEDRDGGKICKECIEKYCKILK